LRLWTGVFYTANGFKQVPIIQVTSGGQKSFLKKLLQVFESQNFSGLWVTKYLFSTIIYKQILKKILQCDFLGFVSLILFLTVEVYLSHYSK